VVLLLSFTIFGFSTLAILNGPENMYWKKKDLNSLNIKYMCPLHLSG
jgi:hypothetical protein